MCIEDKYTGYIKSIDEINEAMASISGILNMHGRGVIYLGLDNDGSPYKSITDDSILRDVSRKIFESIKSQIFPEITVENFDGIEVIKVSFEGKEKPYSAFGKYYKRVADEDREMTPNELRKLIVLQEYEESWENTTSADTLDDVDESTLSEFYESAVKCGRIPEYEQLDVEVLNKLGLVNGKHLTNAGRVLFSKNKPLILKMAVFATKQKETFLDISRVEGNVFDLIKSAMDYVIKNIRWKLSLNDDGIRRVETPEIPIDALREAIVNCFAHARYDENIQHEVDIYSDRIEIVNPGTFANDFKPEDFASRNLHSYLRNENISRVLYLCNNVETFGSGLKKIYRLCEDSGVNVSYKNNDTDFTIIFSRIDRNELPSNVHINGEISNAEAALLDYLSKNKEYNVTQIAEHFNKSARTINRVISSLKQKNLIERVGSNKKGYWKIK